MKADSVPQHSAFDMLTLVMSGEADHASDPMARPAPAAPRVPQPMTADVDLVRASHRDPRAMPH